MMQGLVHQQYELIKELQKHKALTKLFLRVVTETLKKWMIIHKIDSPESS